MKILMSVVILSMTLILLLPYQSSLAAGEFVDTGIPFLALVGAATGRAPSI